MRVCSCIARRIAPDSLSSGGPRSPRPSALTLAMAEVGEGALGLRLEHQIGVLIGPSFEFAHRDHPQLPAANDPDVRLDVFLEAGQTDPEGGCGFWRGERKARNRRHPPALARSLDVATNPTRRDLRLAPMLVGLPVGSSQGTSRSNSRTRTLSSARTRLIALSTACWVGLAGGQR
jgi:hypothetical protein